jgi:chitodextrinase
MTPHFLTRCAAVLLSGLLAAACTMKTEEAPELSGPSEFGTSISITVTPDILQQDGASQSVIAVTARGPNGQLLSGVALRAEIMVGGTLADFGMLSTRNLVTGSDGRATLTYTAPASQPFAVDEFTIVEIAVTPVGTDFGNSAMRIASLRLVPRGVIVPPAGLQPRFTFTPGAPADNQVVLFDATTSQAPANNPIATYSWDFGDGSAATGATVSHAFDEPGTYIVRLTIADRIGRTAETSQTINVNPGASPTARFAISPSPATVNLPVHVNASASTPAPGRQIVSYSWDFGDGSAKASGPQASHTYTRAGSYGITLVVTDDVGRTGVLTQTIQVADPN